MMSWAPPDEKFVQVPGVVEVAYKSDDPLFYQQPKDLYDVQLEGRGLSSDYGKKDKSSCVQSFFRCLPCECDLMSVITLRAHCLGTQHILKALRRAKELRNGAPGIQDNSDRVGLERTGPIDLFSALEADGTRTIVGLRYITEYVDEKDEDQLPFYHCSLFDCKDFQGNGQEMCRHIFQLKHRAAWTMVKLDTTVTLSSQDVLKFVEENPESLERDYRRVRQEKDTDKYLLAKQGKIRASRIQSSAKRERPDELDRKPDLSSGRFEDLRHTDKKPKIDSCGKVVDKSRRDSSRDSRGDSSRDSRGESSRDRRGDSIRDSRVGSNIDSGADSSRYSQNGSNRDNYSHRDGGSHSRDSHGDSGSHSRDSHGDSHRASRGHRHSESRGASESSVHNLRNEVLTGGTVKKQDVDSDDDVELIKQKGTFNFRDVSNVKPDTPQVESESVETLGFVAAPLEPTPVISDDDIISDFNRQVADHVKRCLNRHYPGANEYLEGEITISREEYIHLAKTFSRNLREKLKDSYHDFNRTYEGLRLTADFKLQIYDEIRFHFSRQHNGSSRDNGSHY